MGTPAMSSQCSAFGRVSDHTRNVAMDIGWATAPGIGIGLSSSDDTMPAPFGQRASGKSSERNLVIEIAALGRARHRGLTCRRPARAEIIVVAGIGPTAPARTVEHGERGI